MDLFVSHSFASLRSAILDLIMRNGRVNMNELGVSVYIYILSLLLPGAIRSSRMGHRRAANDDGRAYHDLDHLSPLLSEKRPNELLRAGDDERLDEREFLENELS